ncbi:MAG TPA: mercury methylation ferredoxin HgcB [Anaeromyxobacteraceae bacterium]|nr:mercury methylation ferredoxin HgcB [Anaeromyxobacteraceae bacterium]
MRYLSGVTTLRLEAERCNGCGRCVEVCPHGVFAIPDRRAAVVDRDACMECGACQRNCAQGALTVQAGVGCAAALTKAALSGRSGSPPSCGCDDGGGCCG